MLRHGFRRAIDERPDMPIITADTGTVTQINVFTVPEGGQQALIDLLKRYCLSCRCSVP